MIEANQRASSLFGIKMHKLRRLRSKDSFSRIKNSDIFTKPPKREKTKIIQEPSYRILNTQKRNNNCT